MMAFTSPSGGKSSCKESRVRGARVSPVGFEACSKNSVEIREKVIQDNLVREVMRDS